MAAPLEDWLFTDHASSEMARRDIDATSVEAVLANPEERFTVRPGRDVFQSRIIIDNTQYLMRVFVDVDRSPVEIVTVYLSSKISKYWRSP